MKKIILVLLLLSGLIYAANYKVAEAVAFNTASASTTYTRSFSLDNSPYASYNFYTAGTDSSYSIIHTQGLIGSAWVTLKSDTMTSKLKSVELRNASTDYLKGVNFVRFGIQLRAWSSGDSVSATSYSMNFITR